nr:DUF2726 domain-containing protein [Photobacterium sp. OFAV2-7]
MVLLIKAKTFKKRTLRQDSSNYQSTGALFTAAERSFYGVLTQALKDEYVVFGKVRVADIIKPQSGLSRSQWQQAFNKISAKHIDFVICDINTLSVLCAVELDDSSHQKDERVKRDAFLSEAFTSAKIPLVKIGARRAYLISDIRNQLEAYMATAESPTSDTDDFQACPKCGSALIERVAKRGKNQGESFLGCSSYPKCRYMSES